MFRRFFHHIKEGFYGFCRHIGMALSSASAVMITLILIGLFIVLTFNLYAMTSSIEDSITLSALIKDGTTIQSEDLKRQIEAIEGVERAEFHTKDEEFDYYLETYNDPDLRAFYETYREDNPFKDAFIVYAQSGEDIPHIKDSLSKMSAIDEVYDGGDNTYTLVEVLDNVRIVGGLLVGALCILAIYLIYNTIKITIASRSDEIWIMRNVGAKNGYIRAPFLVEGIIIGFIGALIPMLLLILGYIYLYETYNGSLFGAFSLLHPYPFIFYVALSLLGIGVIVGFFGSYISVFKYLRLRR